MSDTHTSVVGPAPGAGGDCRAEVERAVAALNDHDAAGSAAAYAPDAVVHTAASPEPVRGRAAIEQDTQQWTTAMPDMTMEIEELLVDGPTAAMRLLFVGTHTGPLMTPSGEVPPTGRRVSVPMAVLNRHDESGTTEVEHRHLDMTTMAQQLGLVWPRGCRTPRARSWRGGPGGADRLVQLLDVAADL
ncbi:MAG: ester cyclase [Actinomycetota bacterium]